MPAAQIVLFRHGIARDRTEFAGTSLPDSERPLTDRGVQRTRRAAAGLAGLLPELDWIAFSPYVRARETADLIAAVYDDVMGRRPGRVLADDLQPGGSPARLCAWLGQRPIEGPVALVGHEPDLSELAAWFTTGGAAGFVRFKKAGACLLQFPAAPARGEGEIQWLLPPGVLRRLAG